MTSKGIPKSTSSNSFSNTIDALNIDFHPFYIKLYFRYFSYYDEVVPEAQKELAVVPRGLHLKHARKERNEIRRTVVTRVYLFVLHTIEFIERKITLKCI